MSLRRADSQLQVALITGACSGIGLAMARQLGAAGYTLVLVSQRGPELQATAQQLAKDHGVVTYPLVIDLARPEAALELYQATGQLGLAVDILVSNAGLFFFGEVADADPARANAMLQLHVVTPALLCRYYARDMRQRRRGHILLTSSISAWKDFPGIALYGGSKRFLRSLAASMRSELKVWGVNVTCLAPGATATGLYDPNVIDVAKAKRFGVMMDAEAVARAGLTAMFNQRAVVIPGLLSWLMAWASTFTPQFVIDLIRRRAPWLPRP